VWWTAIGEHTSSTPLGFSDEVVKKCFAGTPTPIGGLGFNGIESYLRRLWREEPEAEEPLNGSKNGSEVWCTGPGCEIARLRVCALPQGGGGRAHAWQPQIVRALQTVVGSTKQGAALHLCRFRLFFAGCGGRTDQSADLIEIRPAGPELAIEQVQPPAGIVRSFVSSAMSFGSLSPEAHQTLRKP